MGKTRKYRGGEFLGEGAHGKAYTISCSTPGDSLCSFLSKSRIHDIIVYTTDAEIHVKPADIPTFLTFLDSQTDSIAKIFKPSGSDIVLRQKLKDEIDMNRQICKLYGSDDELFTTIAPLKGFTIPNIYGACITRKENPTIFVSFGSKCTNRFRLDMKRFLIDILSSLIILHRNGYTHNDIKLDNIVLCTRMYKLIDWGAATPMTFDALNHGTLLGTSPIRWYLLGYNPFISTRIIGSKTLYQKRRVYYSPYFQETNKRITREFNTIVKNKPTKESLFEIYKYNFDVFMLGMTVLHAVIEENLPWDTYKPIVEQFTSLQRPINASDALSLVSTLV
jgi:serine/threonine protein kinase